MPRHGHRTKLHLDALEDRNAASDTLQFLLGGVGLASVLDAQALEATPPLSRRLNLEAAPLSSGVSSVSVVGSGTNPASTLAASPERASSTFEPDEPPSVATSFPDALDSTFALSALAASSATTARGV
jgi:hypothetical protein